MINLKIVEAAETINSLEENIGKCNKKYNDLHSKYLNTFKSIEQLQKEDHNLMSIIANNSKQVDNLRRDFESKFNVEEKHKSIGSLLPRERSAATIHLSSSDNLTDNDLISKYSNAATKSVKFDVNDSLAQRVFNANRNISYYKNLVSQLNAKANPTYQDEVRLENAKKSLALFERAESFKRNPNQPKNTITDSDDMADRLRDALDECGDIDMTEAEEDDGVTAIDNRNVANKPIPNTCRR